MTPVDRLNKPSDSRNPHLTGAANNETMAFMDSNASLAQRYVEINRQVALIISNLGGNDGMDRVSRLVLRAAALQARAHNPDHEVADAMRAFVAEIGQ